jgi:hypothetical protein
MGPAMQVLENAGKSAIYMINAIFFDLTGWNSSFWFVKSFCGGKI